MEFCSRNNKNLSEYIRKTLRVDRYGEPYSTLIVETFVRMQYVLELSPEELREDIQNFANAIKRFRFDKMPDNTMGWYDPNKKEIVFNIDYWQDMMNRCTEEEYAILFFETFAHECMHGMQQVLSKDGTLQNRAGGYNPKTKNRSHAIYEICTQATAAKMARNRNFIQYQQGQILSGNGYSDEIFAVPLIASTFGVSEQVVLKYGMRDRAKLIEELDKHIGNYEYTEQLLSKIEDQLEEIHSITYPDDKQVKYKKMSEDKKKEKKTKAIIELTNLCQSAFKTRIENIPLDVSKDTIAALKSDQKRMLDTLSNEFLYYGYGLEGDYNYLYYKATEFSPDARYVKQSLNILSDVAKDTVGNYSNQKIGIVNCIKREAFNELEQFGFDIDREPTQVIAWSNVALNERRIHKDYNSFVDWDNTDIIDAVYHRDIVTDKLPVVRNYDSWSERRLKSAEGNKKLQVLQKAARLTSKAHGGKDIRYVIYRLINAKSSNEIIDISAGITRGQYARDEFIVEFSSDDDKEYLAKLIAERYISKIYDTKTKSTKAVYNETEMEAKIRHYILPTIEKYGKGHTMYAITKALLDGKYDSISNDRYNGRDQLKLISPNTFIDAVSKPLMDELMQKRTIPVSTKNAIDFAFLETEKKYPGSLHIRVATLVNQYMETGGMNYIHFTTIARDGLAQLITSKEDLELMIGYIADNFSSKAEANQNNRNGNNNANRYYSDLAIHMGHDAFREAAIKAIIYKDYSGFPPEAANYFATIDNATFIKNIIGPTVENVFQMERIFEQSHQNQDSTMPVLISDLRKNAQGQKLSAIDRFLGKLKEVFGFEDRNQNNNSQNNER